MRTSPLLIALCVTACERHPADKEVARVQEKAKHEDRAQHTADSVNGVSVDPDPKPDPSVDDRRAPTERTPEAQRIDLEQERTNLLRSIADRTAVLDAKIDQLERRGDDTKERVAMLRAKRDQVRAKLAEVDNKTRDNWVAFKHDVSDSWDQLEKDVNEATR